MSKENTSHKEGTFILFFIGVFLAYLLSFVRFPFKTILQSFISLPLILPPSVLG
ncbi:hypothetical protein VWM66_10255, partial [Campylobacter jejuni]